MRKLLEGAENVDNFVDDVIGHTIPWSEHLKMLRDFFTRVRVNGLTIRPSKCMIGYPSLDFVGNLVGEGKLEMDSGKVAKIVNAEPPMTKKQLKSFLGMAGWFSSFIPNFSELSASLSDMTKKGKPNNLVWDERELESFNKLKCALAQKPILRLPDFSKPFVLQVDASERAIGCALMQEYEGKLFPVSYGSRKLLDRERHYSCIERESALVFGVRKFEEYLWKRIPYLHGPPASCLH